MGVKDKGAALVEISREIRNRAKVQAAVEEITLRAWLDKAIARALEDARRE